MYFVWWLFDIWLKSIFQDWVVGIWSTESIEQLRGGGRVTKRHAIVLIPCRRESSNSASKVSLHLQLAEH